MPSDREMLIEKVFTRVKKHQWEHSLYHLEVRERQENPLSVSDSQASKLYQHRQSNCRRYYHKI